jgi:hypothetical protein
MSNDRTTWRAEIMERLTENGETWADVVGMTLTDQDLDREFSAGWGSCEGVPFTLWTHRRVYFPTVYDGAEEVRSVPRDPCDEMTRHCGGGSDYVARDEHGDWLEGEDGELVRPGVER